MSVPGIVQSRLDGEQVAAQVPLGGEDALFVTRTRTLVYRADGLLSDESVEEYPHEAERLEVSEGRRKASIELDYGIEGDDSFTVPSDRLYEALHPVLAGVLNAADVTAADETVTQTYQFSELTLVITSERVVKHVGAAVWDEDYEEYHFADVTRLDVEEGSVSSQIVVESGGRPQRIKTPSDQTREVRERIERALLDYHDASSYEAFASEHADADPDGEDRDSPDEAEREAGDDAGDGDAAADPLAGGVDPIEANPPELDDGGGIVDDDATGDSPAGEAEAATDAQSADGQPDDAQSSGTRSADAQSADSGATADARADAGAGATTSEDAGASESATGTGGTAATDAGTDARAGSGDSTDDAGATTTGTGNADDAVGTATTTDESPDSDESSAGDGFADSGFQPASSELEADDTEARLDALTEAVERQNELLAQQQQTLEQLVDELRRGR